MDSDDSCLSNSNIRMKRGQQEKISCICVAKSESTGKRKGKDKNKQGKERLRQLCVPQQISGESFRHHIYS